MEVYSPGSGYHCVLPPLPDGRVGHTMDGLTLCGGQSMTTNPNCISFSSGKWVTSHSLSEWRVGHTSWNIKEEGKIILMGGGKYGARNAETITEGENRGVFRFKLKYKTT